MLCWLGFHQPDAPDNTRDLFQRRRCLRCGKVEIKGYDGMHRVVDWRRE